MRYLLILMVLFACYCVFQYFRTSYYIRVGTTMAAAAVPFSQQPPQPSMRILMAGDSTGVGTGASARAYSIAGLVGARYPQAELVNVAVNGSKTRDVLRQLESVSGTFDLVMIEIGGNDTVRFTDLDQVANDLRAVLAAATKKGKRVLITSTGNVGTAKLFPAGTRWLWQRQTVAVREVFLKQIAAQKGNIRYTDLYRAPDVDPFALDPKKYYAADNFHPSDAGYADWFLLISRELDGFSGL